MAKIKWNGAHEYETGVDHGVLYVKNDEGEYGKGVEWIGLTNITESPEGAEPTDIYADNNKYLTLLSAENFKASIEAYTYPDEFEECDGSRAIAAAIPGVMVGQQVRKVFGLCYRTQVGDQDNAEKGHKIHIIYGCLAAPSERAHATINESPEAVTMSWDLSTTPVEIGEGFKATAHIVIDETKFSTEAQKAKLAAFKDYLYGTDPHTEGSEEVPGTDAQLPLPAKIIELLTPETVEG